MILFWNKMLKTAKSNLWKLYTIEHGADFSQTALKLELLSEVLICDYLTSTLAREMQNLS